MAVRGRYFGKKEMEVANFYRNIFTAFVGRRSQGSGKDKRFSFDDL
jgi:hypothetical protein